MANYNRQLEILYFVQRSGFFIEAGAWDGEQLSNTIFMEVYVANNLIWSVKDVTRF